MDSINDENSIQTNENRFKGNGKPLASFKQRRVLGMISNPAANVVNGKQEKKNSNTSLKPCDQKSWPNLKADKLTAQTNKTSLAANSKSSSSIGFSIFVDSFDSENNFANNENECLDLTLDDTKDDMDLCEPNYTDNILSECTEISLAIDETFEEIGDENAEPSVDIRCEESIDFDTDDETELEETSLLENTSETYRSFDLTALSKCKEYANEIHYYLLLSERKRMADPFYIGKQPEINAKMRSILVDWLVEVTEEYRLLDQTLFLAVNYIDRFLSLMSVSRQSFQLLGTAALFIASKYEEIYPPELSEFVYITDDSYTKTQILNMEKLVLKALQFDVSAPTTYYFVEKFCSQLELPPAVKNLAKYLCHLTLLESEPFLRFYPSEIAVCSLILSAETLGVQSLITEQFIEYSILFEKDLKAGDIKNLLSDRQTCMEALYRMHAFAQKHPQQAIQTKYTSDKLYGVSHIEPMSTLPRIN